MGQELLVLLASLDHLLSHCSHLCPVCLGIQEALGVPTENKITGEVFLQEYKDLRQEEKGTTEDEMVGWHQQLNGHEFE